MERSLAGDAFHAGERGAGELSARIDSEIGISLRSWVRATFQLLRLWIPWLVLERLYKVLSQSLDVWILFLQLID